MLTPGMNDHGLGPVITADGLRFGHGGADDGFQAEMTGFLDGRAGVVVMTNSGQWRRPRARADTDARQSVWVAWNQARRALHCRSTHRRTRRPGRQLRDSIR